MASVTTAARPHAFTLLLDRYVAATISDAAFAAVCEFPEEADATPAERLAFARFYLDVLASGEPETPLPQPHEIADVLQIARA